MKNGKTPGRHLSCYNTRRSCTGEVHMPYESMLLKELPDGKLANTPLHAVLESELGDNVNDGIKEAQKVRNHALIHYLASLATSNNNDDVFDYDFVESLIANGADVDSTDKNGQTIFHEVARSWNVDIALFLLEHGANVNKQDIYGRSPLHVAAAVDYADMVEFLVKNGADVNIMTYGENQMPIHFAAKNDACKSLKMLLGYGANIDSRDSKNRTPLQVAAEMNRAKSAKFLVQNGAPAGVHDNMGNSALSLLIEKLPDVALQALDQFHSINSINRKEFFFLNYLEGNRLQNPKSPAYSALEIAVHHHEYEIVLHPVMKRLIDVKWQQFGRQGAVTNLCLNLLYAILWTILAVTSPPDGNDLYLPWTKKSWRLVVSLIVGLMTLDEIRRQITGTIRTRNRQKKWIAWRASELEEDLQYCHPRWPQEQIYLKSEIKVIKNTRLISSGDSWIYFDWFSLFLILATIASHLVFFNINSALSQILYARTITVLLLVLWIRIAQYARPFENVGPFVAIFSHVFKDIVNWGILTILITVPYACAFWITFGESSRNSVESYSSASSLIYGLFSMIVVGDFDFESLLAADAAMARILCGSYIAIMAIINLNILIALLSDTFSRVYGNAVANAVMQRAKTILFLEKSLTKKGRSAYHEFIKKYGSPETVELQQHITGSTDRDEQKASEMLKESVKEIHELIHERFGMRYGEEKKSDLDHIKESLAKIHQGEMVPKESYDNFKKLQKKVSTIQRMLLHLGKALNIDMTAAISVEQSSDDDDDTLVDDDKKSSSRWNMKRGNSRLDEEEGKENMEVVRGRRTPHYQFWDINNPYHIEEGQTTLSRSARDSMKPKRSNRDVIYYEGRARDTSDYRQPLVMKPESVYTSHSSRYDEFLDMSPRDLRYREPRDATTRRIYRYDLCGRDENRHHYYELPRLPIYSNELPHDRMRESSRDTSRSRSRGKYDSKRDIIDDYSETPTLPRRSRSRKTSSGTYYPEKEGDDMSSSFETDTQRKKEIEKRNRTKDEEAHTSHEHRLTRGKEVILPSGHQVEGQENAQRGRSKQPGKRSKSRDIAQGCHPSKSESQASDSDEVHESRIEDNPIMAFSDNDVIQKRASRIRDKKYIDDWDNRSAKSVAF